MRRFLLVRLDALQLQRFHGPRLAVDILLQAFQPFTLLDHDAVQLLHLVFQVGDGGFKLFSAPGMFVSHGRILPAPPSEVEGADELTLRRGRFCGTLAQEISWLPEPPNRRANPPSSCWA